MIATSRRSSDGRRRGAATVELAILLPFLCLFCLGAIDYARAFSYAVVVANCARNGAMYASDPNATADTPYTSLTQAALADAGGISPTPTVTSANGTDSNGDKYVDVTVSYTFQTLVSYPGIPSTITLTRTVRAAISPP